MDNIDKVDIKILKLLVRDGNIPRAKIARSIGLTPTAVFERVRKLETRGFIRGYAAQLSPETFGKKLLSYVFISEIKPIENEKTSDQLLKIPGIEELHRIAGKDCFLLKIRSQDTSELTDILDQIGEIETVGEVSTSIVLETFIEKQWSYLPENLKGDN